jgi:hypothetical protein
MSRKPRWRLARIRELRSKGTPQARRFIVWHVSPSKLIPIPEEFKAQAIPGLTISDAGVWLRTQSMRSLALRDRLAGGAPWIEKSEFKRCELCGRPMIGTESEGYRVKLEEEGRGIVCGEHCNRDREAKTWIRIYPKAQNFLDKAKQRRKKVA